MLVDPLGVFGEIERQPRKRILLPLAIIISSSLIVLVTYYQVVDLDWLADTMLAKSNLAQQKAAKPLLTRTFLTVSGVTALIFGVIVINAIMALFFFLCAKVQGSSRRFGEWFAFVVWTGAPSLLLLPVGFFAIFASGHGQISPDQLNPTSLNQLFFHLGAGEAWAGLLNSISIVSLWTTVLAVIGLRVWTSMSWTASILIGSMPSLLLYGTWLIVTLVSVAA